MKANRNYRQTRKYFYKEMESPVGKLKLVASELGLAAILWENDPPKRVPLGEMSENKSHPVLVRAELQLNEYFQWKRRAFSIKLDPMGTPFQRKVWQALSSIPYSETRNYGQLAGQIGNAKAARAVGAANGRNPLSIIVPCHRVIGVSGKLTGFAGGLKNKDFLLRLEAGAAAGKRKSP